MEQPQNIETNNSLWNWFLSICAGIFTIMENCSADEIYTWFFRGISSLSIILIIIINWKKAYYTLFPGKKPKDFQL